MILAVRRTAQLRGAIRIPASKSHTIRAIIIASLAHGCSTLLNPLVSEDTRAAINACQALGAEIEMRNDRLVIRGCGGRPRKPAAALDMLNSGTTTNLMLGILGACGLEAEVTGDQSLRSRPVKALAEALTALGCTLDFLDRPGYPPLRIAGKFRGGTVRIDASKSSQYVSSLLLSCPLAEADTEILVENPTELPYIDMTLQWLDAQRVRYTRHGYCRFTICGRQGFGAFERSIPADWSSATFPICAAAVTDSDVVIRGVDSSDVQGDKAVAAYLRSMGAHIAASADGLRVRGACLRAADVDLNATPDALPALAVVACCAQGALRLYNVAQARVKETDRIRVMAAELQKMGARIEELPDGLHIQYSALTGAAVRGHHDHRVVMALSIAGLVAEGTTTIDTAEAVAVTYPQYVSSMQALGARFTTL